MKSIARFIWWQVQSGLSSRRFFVKSFVKPVKFYVRKGLTGLTGNIYTGLHEFNDMGFLLHFLRAEDVFFDIGANVGSFTLLSSGVCGAISFALEPVPGTFDILGKNVGLNSLQDKVSALNAAAGAAAGSIAFTTGLDTTNHVVAADEKTNGDTVNVPVITIDSLSIKNPPSLIKIDVEGYETEALKGMGDTLNAPSLKAIIIELNGDGERYGYNEQDIHELLVSKDFKPFTYDPFTRVLTEVTAWGKYNTIYCRDLDFINGRLKQAEGFRIMGELI